jgi:hypothetical protein
LTARCRESGNLLDISSVYSLLDAVGQPDYSQEAFTVSTTPSHPFGASGDQVAEREFLSAATTPLKLSTVKHCYERKDGDQAARLLNRKIRYVVDDHLKIAPGLASFTVPDHSLDFLLLIPKEPGLDVLRPPEGEVASLFTLDLSKPTRLLSTKHGLFGFDVEGAALYLGRKEQENIWLVMVEPEVLDAASPAVPAGSTPKGPTSMSRRHL